MHKGWTVFSRALIYVFAIAWTLVTLYPLYFLIQNSFKSSTEFFRGDVWNWPTQFTLSHYQKVWETHFLRFFFNSVYAVGASLAIILVTGGAAGFGLSRIKFRLRGLFYYLFIGGLTIPIHITLIPVYIITRDIGIYDTLFSLIGPFVGFSLPMAVFILAAFMVDIPASLEEAAFMDGATWFQVYRNIVLPISRPAMTAVGIYSAVGLWNEFIFPLVLINTEAKRPLTLALWNFQGEFSADIPSMMAALILTALPLLIFYAFTKDKLIEGLVAGALKG